MSGSIDKIRLPVGGAEVVKVDHLPDVQDLLSLLESEGVPLSHWWDLARAYLAEGQTAQYLQLLNGALDPELLQAATDFFKRRPTFEIVQLNCGYAAHHIEQYRLEQDKAAKQQHYADALARIAAAKAEGPEEQLPWLAGGCLMLAKGDSFGAMQEFKQAAARLHNREPNYSGQLAVAALHFQAGRLAEALETYKEVLRKHPGAPAEVRLGLAACFYKAGRMDLAQTAYERVIELQPHNPDALLGLATLHLNSSASVQQGLASATELLAKAFQSDPGHPGVLAALAHFMLLQGHAERALQLADAALLAADTDQLRAFATTLRARTAHALGRLQEAERGYTAAIRMDAKAPLPHLGVAQMYLKRGEGINAASELETVLKETPANIDALRLLGALSADMPERVERSAQHFKDAAAKHPDDPELLEMLAELLSISDPRGSLEAYEAALAAHRKRQQAAARPSADGGGEGGEGGSGGGGDYRVPAKLLNNVAVLRFRAGRVHDALALLQEAVEHIGEMDALHKVTLGYNTARVKEAAGDLKAAAADYEQLVGSFPSYADCYLRLACIARTSGSMEEAVEWASKAGASVDANALLATLHLERNDLDAAKKCIDGILKAADPAAGKQNGAAHGGGGGGGGGAAASDPYAKLALANVFLKSMPAQARTPEARAKARSMLEKAQRLYREVLKAHKANAFAANGLGVCLAETGHLDEAREAFAAVQEAAVNSKGFMQLPDVYINQANVALAKEAYEQALALYERASAAHHHKNAQFLLYKARALYDKDDLQGARRALEAAIHVAPTDAKLRFNLALCLQEWAVRVFKRKRPDGDPTKVAEYEEAVERLEQAAAVFQALALRGKEATKIEARKLQVHIDFCGRTFASAQQHLEAARREAAIQEAKRVAYDESLRAAEAAKAEEELTKRAQAELRRREEAAEIKKAQEAFQGKIQDWAQRKQMIVEDPDKPSGKSGSKKRRRKGKGDGGGDDFLADEDEGGRKGSDNDSDAEEALRRAGLASDEDDGGGAGGGSGSGSGLEDLFGGDEDSGGGSDGGGKERRRKEKKSKRDKDRAAASPAPAAAGGGRLKRKAAAADAADDGGGGEGGGVEDLFGDDDIFADPEENAAGGGGGGGGELEDEEMEDGGGGGSARKRARHGAAISDSDEEGEAGGGGGAAAGAPAAAGGGAEEEAFSE